MIKTLTICLLVGVALSAPLTPLTSLPPAYDDMLFNKLQGHKVGQTYKVAPQITKDLSRMSTLPEVSNEIKRHIDWVSAESIQTIFNSFSTISEDKIETHFIQTASSDKKSKSGLIQLLVVKNNIKLISISATHQAYQDKYIHVLYESKFGFAPAFIKTLIGTLPATAQKAHDFLLVNVLFAGLQQARGSQKGDLMAQGMLGQTTFTGVLDAIKAVASAWQSVASAFKTVNRETFKYVIKGQGFSQYQQSSIFLRSLGIDLRKWEQFKPLYMTSTGMDSPASARDTAEVFLTLAEFMPDNTWQFNDHTFDKNGQGSTTTMVAFTKADLDVQKAHVLTVVTSGSYMLAPDVYVYEKYKSVAGGIYQNTKEVRKNVPRNLTLEDIKGINAMAMLNAINVMTKYFNIDFKLPSDDPLKLV